MEIRIRIPMTFNLFKRTALAALAVTLGTGIANAQIVLTVDTSNRTLTWSGTATSDEFIMGEGVNLLNIRLGFGGWIGGRYAHMPEGALVVSSSTSNFGVGPAHPTIVTGSLYANLGSLENWSGDSFSATVTVTGNGVPFSYLEDYDEQWVFLGSLDGEALYFQEDFGGAGVFNYGEAAGFVAVIPEPSTVALLLGGLSALLVLKRRRE